MQQTGKLTVSRLENPFDGLRFDGFIGALSMAILSKGSDLETVWEVTNRVYDRWNRPTEWTRGRADEDLALSA